MTIMHAPQDAELAALLKRLLGLERSAISKLALLEETLPELRRQARAMAKRRGGEGSIDAEKYRFGSILILLGFGGAEDLKLLGLLACGDRALQWLAEARLQHGPMTFADAVKIVLADPVRAEWCRRWGEYRRRTYKKAVYDASVTAFIESGKAGPKEGWRRDEITPDQAGLIEDICETLSLPTPELSNRGDAFEWIYAHGGKPAYWEMPSEPDEWKD